VEVVVYCGMTALQREYYARVLDGTLRDALVGVGIDGAKKLSLINPLMNLRKVCNHPYLFGELDSAANVSAGHDGRLLMAASGKFKLLHRMLPRLKKEGSKVRSRCAFAFKFAQHGETALWWGASRVCARSFVASGTAVIVMGASSVWFVTTLSCAHVPPCCIESA
jgi:SNF2 family DNA or RNA helicase